MDTDKRAPAVGKISKAVNGGQEILNKQDNRGDILPTVPEDVQFRMTKERVDRELGLEPEDEPLTFKEETFIKAYFANGLNHRDAAQRARISYNQIAEVTRKPNVRRAMDERQRAVSKTLEIDHAKIVADLYDMYQTDLHDIVEHRRGACRYCWGKNGLYQWKTKRERQEHKQKYPKDSPKRLSYGGLGYTEYADPNPDCAECSGQGEPFVHVKDTIGLKGVSGIEYSPSGKITVRGYDKLKLAETLLRHIGSLNPYDGKPANPNQGPQIQISGGLPADLLEVIKGLGSLANLEQQVQIDAGLKVAELDAAATAEEEAEIAEMIAKGETD